MWAADAVSGYVSAGKASKAAQQTADKNIALFKETRDQNVALQKPWMDLGLPAGQQINALLMGGPGAEQAQQNYGNYRDTVSSGLRLQNGLNGGYQNQAVNGLLRSGSTIKAAEQYRNNFDNQDFGNYLGYLGNQQRVGVGATNALSGVNTDYANGVGQQNTNAGDARANGYLAQGNAIGGAFNNLTSMLSGGLGYASSYGK